MTINQILFKKLEEKKIKQSELAEYLGIAKTVVTNWKNRGNNPASEYLIPICELLDIDIYTLLSCPEKRKYNNLITAYEKADIGTKAAVDKLLDIKDQGKLSISEKENKIG